MVYITIGSSLLIPFLCFYILIIAFVFFLNDLFLFVVPGVDMSETAGTHYVATRSRSMSRGPAAKRARAMSSGAVAVQDPLIRQKSLNRGRSLSNVPRDEQGIKDLAMKSRLNRVSQKAISKKVKKKGLKGEADRFIGTKMPRHLFSGKRGVGKTDRR